MTDPSRRRRRRFGALCAVVALLAGLLTACDAPAKVYTYRIATRGPVTVDVAEFSRSAAATLSDPRGWSLGGAIEFRELAPDEAGEADFTLWLTTADQVPSFGPPCSVHYSCRISDDVVINESRWLLATPAWLLRIPQYRAYVVNHEVGHWLSLGHEPCTTGAGSRAPVMAQQSKGSEAVGVCRFNAWPTTPELWSVAVRHGVTLRSPNLPELEAPFGRLVAVEDASPTGDAGTRAVRIEGWAIDGDTTDPLDVVVRVDGQRIAGLRADRPRLDVAVGFPHYGAAHGFDTVVEVPSTASTLCVGAVGVGTGPVGAWIGCEDLPPSG